MSISAANPRTIHISTFGAGGQPTKLSKEFQVPESLSILEDPKDCPAEGYGCFRIMTPEDGDKRVVWNRMRLEEIQDAKATFDSLVASGMVPYRVGPKGQRTNDVMRMFDAVAEEIVFVPSQLLAGG